MLFYLTVILLLANLILIYLLIKRIRKEKEIRKEAIERSRQVLEGRFKEQLAPILPEFKYNPSDARFLGTPIDFIIFDGASENKIRKIIFLEIKSGESKLTEKERQIENLVKDKKIEFKVLNI
jgi:predicted Holliday junction resolvase-like endonuclease